MAPNDSAALATVDFAGDALGARLRGFFTALTVLRFALPVLASFFRPAVFLALPCVLFFAINASSP